MKKSFAIHLFATICFFSSFKAISQDTLVGPACVISGSEYQYNIKGNIPEGAQLCVAGGKISGASADCITNLSSGYVRIVWSGSKGSVSFSSSEGNSSIDITITLPLQPGSITTNKVEFISFKASCSSIFCSKPYGGGCGASYYFQWQRSLDNVNWEDIKGATNQNLGSLPALTETFFYRRKTTDNTSESPVYSDAVVVYVAPDTNGH